MIYGDPTTGSHPPGEGEFTEEEDGWGEERTGGSANTHEEVKCLISHSKVAGTVGT